MPDETTKNDAVVSSTLNDTTPVVSSSTPSKTASVQKVTQQNTQKKSVMPVKKQMPFIIKPAMPTNVDKVLNLIGKFETAVAANEETISAWINLCNYLNRTNDPKVFQSFYVWFAKHLKDYTSPEIALNGVHNIQNGKTKTRVSSTHQCFEELARVLASKNSHYRFTLKAMQAMEISEFLARWFLSRGSR